MNEPWLRDPRVGSCSRGTGITPRERRRAEPVDTGAARRRSQSVAWQILVPGLLAPPGGEPESSPSQLVPRRATMDRSEARVLALTEPEPAFARPVRDP